MQYERCKCGKSEAWSSGMPSATCTPCGECGTIPASHPDHHPEVTEHDFSSIEKVQTDQGEMTITRCRLCHRTRKQIEDADGS